MIRLAGFMKPFIAGCLAAVCLLFVQVLCDLNLPNLMSDIVNVGIQQSGIENSAPEYISENALEFITAFMTESDAKSVYGGFEALDGQNKADKGLSHDGTVYAKKTGGPELDRIFGDAAWTFIMLMRDLNPSDSPDSFSAEDMDMGKLLELAPMIKAVPVPAMEAAREKAAALDESLKAQTGVVFAKMFMEELNADVSGLRTSYILKTGLFMLAVALLGGIATVFVGLLSTRIAAGAARDLRRAVFEKIQRFSSAEFEKFSTASLITRSTNDVTQIQVLISFGIRMLAYAPIMAVGGVIMALAKSLSMAWIIAIACVAMGGLMLTIFTVAMPKFKLVQKLVDRLNLVSRENLNGLMVIRAVGSEDHEKERFDRASLDLANTNLFINRVMVFMMPVMTLIMNGVTILVIWTGAHEIAQSNMQVGDMIAFMQYAMMVIMSFLLISVMFIFVPRAAVSAARIAEVLDSETSVLDPASPVPFDQEKRGVVEFKNVNFRYEGAEKDVLHDITFTAAPGTTTAIIGSTGSGKSTVINLLLRLFDATSGEVLVSGVNVRDVLQRDLRDRIGFSPQNGDLLSGNIASNLRYGKKDAPESELEEAADIAQAIDFIEAGEEKFDAPVSAGGSNLSGGQRQRLAIARALVKRPDIYIFDDSFSALDFKTDARLRQELKRRTGSATVIIVAQRVGTIMSADQIIVLEQGRIVGIGRYDELMKSCPEFTEISSSQLTKGGFA